MKLLLIRILHFLLKPLSLLIYKRALPNFAEDFPGKPVFMISELPGGEDKWVGMHRRNAKLGNTHPWNRYFNKPLNTHPKTLADIETFLLSCKYVSDRKTRSQSDFWEPPDIFERRRTGDCEDHAIWAWRNLDELGYKVRLVLGKCKRWHAWVHIFVNGRAYLFEATQKHKWFPYSQSYDAHWSVERVGKKKFAFFLHGGHEGSHSIGFPEFGYKWPQFDN